MDTAKEVYFIAGVYGVGKSTFCDSLSKKIDITTYSASDLISVVNGEQYGSSKLVKNKGFNQNILTSSVKEIMKQNTKIILSGHFCIFGKNSKVDILEHSVFDSLYIKKIVLLESDIDTILKRLNDRDKKNYSKKDIAKLQLAEKAQAIYVSKLYGFQLLVHTMSYDPSDILNIENFIKGRA